jgi:hypothetical protein
MMHDSARFLLFWLLHLWLAGQCPVFPEEIIDWRDVNLNCSVTAAIRELEATT